MLIDHKRWAEANGKDYSPFSDKRITIQELEEVAKAQGVEFKQGDILIVRTGFTEGLGGKSGEEQEKLMGSHQCCGVHGVEETAKWVWNKHFSAVAGDAIAFETIPPVNPDGSPAGIEGLGKQHTPITILGPWIC